MCIKKQAARSDSANFIHLDAVRRKVPRRASVLRREGKPQERIRRREAVYLAHTQGSGTRAILIGADPAKWLMETTRSAHSRIITDRDELRQQIEGDKKRRRDRGGVANRRALNHGGVRGEGLGAATRALICGARAPGGLQFFSTSATRSPQGRSPPVTGALLRGCGRVCHRTAGRRMTSRMKGWLEGAVFIGLHRHAAFCARPSSLTRDVLRHLHPHHEVSLRAVCRRRHPGR